ncbi:hypothetical protein NMG60_11017108 [Bertholletia excelsa]
MAAPPAQGQAQVLQNNGNSSTHEVSRQDIQAAIAKTLELRALHAALFQSNSPANPRFHPSSPSPLPPHHSTHFSAQDYPIFTPTYEGEPLPRYQQIQLENQTTTECWEEYGLGEGNGDGTFLSEYKRADAFSRNGLPPKPANLEPHSCPAEDQKSVASSCANTISFLRTSPGTDFYNSSRQSSLGNKCKPAITRGETTDINKNCHVIVPLTDSHSSLQSQPRNRGLNLSWLFPRMKKKHKSEASPNRTESEEVSQVLKDMGMMSIESLKRELIEANESRDAALLEVAEMKSSLGELSQKLSYLETYCEELKKALRQAVQTKESRLPEKLENLTRKGKAVDKDEENQMPVSKEVMVEGFLQIVSEARLSVKQFCKILLSQIEETDDALVDNINMLLQPYKLSLKSKYSKAVLYHLEAFINQSLYQDFENCVFQKNGSPKLLDPRQDRQAQFSSFVALRNLGWNEVLRKGTKYYSEEFSKFCDQKMSYVIATLNWTRPWPEQLLQSFFVAAKCIWLLHLLAFSFSPPLGILRVEENRSFDAHYMEDLFTDRQKQCGPSRVKIMVMPGFYVQDRVLRCKVLCRYKNVA